MHAGLYPRYPIVGALLAIVLIALIGSARHKKRSWSTILEFVVFLGLLYFSSGVTFYSFYAAKFLMSTAVFFVGSSTLLFRGCVRKTAMYFLGFPTGGWQAAIADGNTYYRSALPPRNPRNAVPGLWKPTAPETTSLISAPQTVLVATCSVCMGIFLKIKHLLASCGHYHNWALITLHNLSADKFFSLHLLSCLRWEMWILVGLFATMHYLVWTLVPVGASDLVMSQLYVFPGFCGEFLLALLVLWDSLDLYRGNMSTNRRKKQAVTICLPVVSEAIKCSLLMLVWYCLVSLSRVHWVLGHPSLQLIGLLLLTFVTATLMRCQRSRP